MEASQCEDDVQISAMIDEFLKLPPVQQERLRMETPPYLIRRSCFPEMMKMEGSNGEFKCPEFKRKY